jgi:hypothetical protein
MDLDLPLPFLISLAAPFRSIDILFLKMAAETSSEMF